VGRRPIFPPWRPRALVYQRPRGRYAHDQGTVCPVDGPRPVGIAGYHRDGAGGSALREPGHDPDRVSACTAFFQSAKGTFESRPGLVHNLGFEKFGRGRI
jgi:hypothetical protein